MKLLHLGDLHLGKSLRDFDLIEDQRYILEQILAMADTEQVDAVLLAGDIYDRTVPSEAAVRLLDFFLASLAERGIRTFVISGNHDSDDRLQFGSTLFEAKGVYISAVYDGTLYKKTMQDEQGEVDIYLLPFVKASQIRNKFPEETIESYEDAIRVILKKAAIDTTRRNVLVAHQFVAGRDKDPEFGGSEGMAVDSVGLVEKIGYDCFDDFDYVALGHIHSPQQIGRETVRYSGSLLKYSADEAAKDKSVPIITLGKKGEVKVELKPLVPLRDVRQIRGRRDQLLNPANIVSPDDYIFVTLTDEEYMENPMGIFQEYYPHTVKVIYDNSHTREVGQVEIAEVGNNRSFTELISDFYRQIYSCDISEEELEIMRQVAEEAGVDSETN